MKRKEETKMKCISAEDDEDQNFEEKIIKVPKNYSNIETRLIFIFLFLFNYFNHKSLYCL